MLLSFTAFLFMVAGRLCTSGKRYSRCDLRRFCQKSWLHAAPKAFDVAVYAREHSSFKSAGNHLDGAFVHRSLGLANFESRQQQLGTSEFDV